MIRTVADLLFSLIQKTVPILDSSDITHAPTIGDMYEGLSRDVLERSIPAGLSLRVVEGFATDGWGNMSGQLDCMLVQGEGSPIPYTNSYTWHVKDIIAVIEVKKTLRSAEMADALQQLRSVRVVEEKCRQREISENSGRLVDLHIAETAFAETTRQAVRFKNIAELPERDQMIYHTLVLEQLSIVRIVMGLHGFKSESAFRKALVQLLKKNLGVRGFSPFSLPQLIVSGNYSLIKANGRPYSVRTVNDEWPFYLSSPVNPLILLLEVIWTRLDERFGLSSLWGEDLETEVLNPLLLAWAVSGGWHYRIIPPSFSRVRDTSSIEPWSPVFLTYEEFVVVHKLCLGREVLLDDDELLRWLAERNIEVDSLRNRLLDTGLVGVQGRQLKLITHDCACAVLPTGEYIAAENNTGRLTRWIKKRLADGHQGGE